LKKPELDNCSSRIVSAGSWLMSWVIFLRSASSRSSSLSSKATTRGMLGRTNCDASTALSCMELRLLSEQATGSDYRPGRSCANPPSGGPDALHQRPSLANALAIAVDAGRLPVSCPVGWRPPAAGSRRVDPTTGRRTAGCIEPHAQRDALARQVELHHTHRHDGAGLDDLARVLDEAVC
jgi:hypothetical protein